MSERPLLRVFVSSTAEDLKDHRARVFEALLLLGDLPVAMEAFGADPGDPVEVCRERVRECDILIVLVGRRYGWVPRADEGGDDRRSITWIEVDTALEAGKPVFAFLEVADPSAAEPAEDGPAIGRLREFREFLERDARLTRDVFTTPDNLGMKVATSVSGAIRPSRGRLRVWIAATVVLLVGLVCEWLQVFSGSIDPATDDLVMGYAERLDPTSVDDRIAIAMIDQHTIDAFGVEFGPSWRAFHAEFVSRLSRARAHVIAFDIFFPSPTEHDLSFRDAIKSARSIGCRVVVGVAEWGEQQPQLSEILRSEVSGFGSLCTTERKGAERFVSGALESRGRSIVPAFAVSVFAAAGEYDDFAIMEIGDRPPRMKVSLGGEELWWRVFETIEVTERDKESPTRGGVEAIGCPLESVGDKVALLAFEPTAREAIGSRILKYEDLISASESDLARMISGKIVFVGVDSAVEERRVTYALSKESRLGVRIHADALNTLLAKRLLHPAGHDVQIVLLVVNSFIGAWLVKVRLAWLRLLGILGMTGGVVAVALFLHVGYAIVLRPVYPLFALYAAATATWFSRPRWRGIGNR